MESINMDLCGFIWNVYGFIWIYMDFYGIKSVA